MKRLASLVALTLLALVALVAPPAGADDGALDTRISLLVGHPSADADDSSRGVLLIPGTVIPVSLEPKSLARSAVDAEAARSARLLDVADRLQRTMRLDRVEVTYQMPLALEVDVARDLPGPSATSALGISVTLRGFNAETALYEVQFHDRSTPIVDTSAAVERGGRAVIGGLDGEAAPYLFLVVEPAAGPKSRPTPHRGSPLHVGGDVTPPRALVKVPPSYTEEARKERVQGVVIVRAVIDKAGEVAEVEVLKGLEMGLTEAAVEAIRTWRFEPALLDGEPVSVYYNLTINFRLDKEKKEDHEGE